MRSNPSTQNLVSGRIFRNFTFFFAVRNSWTMKGLWRRSQRLFPLALVVLVGLYAVLLLWQFENVHFPTEKPTGVIILKLPRSGSSWFVQLLNKVPDVYISKEIVQRDDLSRYSLKKRVDHVVRSTSVPTDKLSQSRSYYPSTRALEDYWLHNSGKPWRSLRAMGCSVNPEYLKEMNWDAFHRSHQLSSGSDYPHIILYLRSNIVKQSLSAITGQRIKKVCGSANLRSSAASPGDFSSCKDSEVNSSPWNEPSLEARFHSHNNTVTVPLSRFVDEVERWIARYTFLFKYMDTHLIDTHLVDSSPQWRIQRVYYEDLQADTTYTILQALSFLHIDSSFLSLEDLLKPANADTSFMGLIRRVFGWNSWQKRTPDNISHFLANYQVLLYTLHQHPSTCTTLREMLEEKSFRVFREAMSITGMKSLQNCVDTLRKEYNLSPYNMRYGEEINESLRMGEDGEEEMDGAMI